MSNEIPKKKYYVTMTDKFMSGWGRAVKKINKFVVGCNTFDQVKTIIRNAEGRSEMKYVNWTYNKPYYDQRKYLVSYQDYKSLCAG